MHTLDAHLTCWYAFTHGMKSFGERYQYGIRAYVLPTPAAPSRKGVDQFLALHFSSNRRSSWTDARLCLHYWVGCRVGWNLIVRRAGLLWSQQDFEWRWSVPLFKCLTVLEFSCILFDLCLLITFFNFIMNYVPIVTFWIFTYHKIWILSIMFCSIWSYWIIYFLPCLEVSWRVVS